MMRRAIPRHGPTGFAGRRALRTGNGRSQEPMADVRIVLVEPSHPGNIGGAARAMKTMGLASLYLVRPARFPDPQADWRAARAVDVLAEAKVVDSVDEAIGDCVLAVGTSTRSRRIPIPLADARTVAERLASEYADEPVAILFGRETSGLTNEELQRCQMHLSIPASPEYPSLNLAMSVQVVCYELFKTRSAPKVTAAPASEPGLASLDEVEGFLAHFEKVLTRIDFLKPSAPRQAMPRLRRMFSRIGLEQTEVGMLRGILTHIEKLSPTNREEEDSGRP